MQPGFDLPRQQWSLLNRFAPNRDTAVPAEGNGDLQTLICVLVVKPRRYTTLSNPVPWQNWMVAYLSYTLRMKTLFHGWPVMVHGTHTRRRTVSPPPLFLLSDAEWNECTGWQNCEFDSCTFFSAVERGRLVTRHIAQTHRWRQHPNGRLDMAQYLCHMATCRWRADIINHNACQRQRLTVWNTTVCILSPNHHEICTVTIIK